MKGNLKKIAAGGVSIGLAVALLATSLTSHKPVQAVDVFSQTKDLVQPSGLYTFDIVELISERSTFPTVLFNEQGEYAQLSEGQVHIGKEELAYLVGGEEPFAKFWKDLSSASWMVSELEKSIEINTAKDSLIAGLEKAGLLDISDLTGHPLKAFISENFTRPDQLDKILDGAFLEVMKYPNDESNGDIIGYFVPMEEDTGCYMWNVEKGKMEYVGARMARAEAAMHIEFQSGWNSNYIGDWESEEDLYDEYEDDEFWDEFESGDEYWDDYENDDYYDPRYELYQYENDNTYIENDDVSEERIVEYYYPDEEYTQSTVEVVIPPNQAGLSLDVEFLAEEPIVGEEGRMYNFYTVAEIEAEEANGLDDTKITKIPVYGDNVGDLRVFRYITLTNNEWLKTQVFGIEESIDATTNAFSAYPIHVYSVKTMDAGEQDDENSKHNLKATDGDELSRIIASSSGTEVFADSVKLFYVAQIPGNDISKNLRNNILNRVSNNTMACIVNDANIRTILGVDLGTDEEEDADDNTDVGVDTVHPTLQNLVSYLYQEDLAKAWDITMADTTPALEEGDRVNVNKGVAHFVRKNVYAIDTSFVDSAVSLYDIIYQGVDEGFDDVVYRIEQENYQREQDSQIYDIPFERIENVTRALSIQYILTYSDNPVIMRKSGIRVLELQPAYDFTYAPMEYIHSDVTVKEEVKETDGTTSLVPRGQEARISQFKKDFFGDENFKLDVEIVGMTTSEFCGKIEDLNVEYDMIYWGTNLGTLNTFTNGEGETIRAYNDRNMIGMVYTHVGDINLAGYGTVGGDIQELRKYNENGRDLAYVQPKDYGYGKVTGAKYRSVTFRYSGNDILENQVDKLLSFLAARYPIVVDDNFFVKNLDTTDGVSVDEINSSDVIVSNSIDTGNVANNSGAALQQRGALDTSSYVYQFVKKAVSSGYPNLMTFSQATSDVENNPFTEYINQPKISVVMISQPIEYSYSTRVENGVSVIDGANYLEKNRDGHYYLEYEFYIANASNANASAANYTAELFIDANMDGRFTNEENMNLSQSNIVEVDTELPVNVNSLKIGTVYRVRMQLPDQYIGAVPWRITIFDSNPNNSETRGSFTGLTAVKEQKQDVFILQFLQRRNSNYSEQYLGDVSSTRFGSRPQMWTTLLNNVPDFNVHILTVDIEDYFGTNKRFPQYGDDESDRPTLAEMEIASNFKPSTGTAAKGYLTDTQLERKYAAAAASASKNRVFDPTLQSYDMILLGYTDGFLETNGVNNYGNRERIQRLMDYMDSGKCVLFTHDTSGAFNTNANFETLNIYTRDMAGQDRFGITIGRGGNKSNYNLTNNATVVQGQGNTDEEKRSDLINKLFRSEQGILGKDRDVAFKPGTNQTVMTEETTALVYTSWDTRLNTRNNEAERYELFNFDYDKVGADRESSLSYFKSNKNYGGTIQCTIGQVNKGVITQYPYVLPETLDVDQTHCQYYQLDLDSDADDDGEGDIVVWYTINSALSDAPDAYDISPNDVRNNYYIYNKGNITYTGMGQKPINNETEIKLFINTMIASYRVGTRNPDVSFVQDFSNAMVNNAATIPYDDDVTVDGTYPIYFQIKDNNLVTNERKFIVYNAYLVDPNGPQINIGTDDDPKYIKGYDISRDSSYPVIGSDGSKPKDEIFPQYDPDGRQAQLIDNERIYQMQVPLSLLKNRDVVEIYVVTQAEVFRNGLKNISSPVSTKYTISKMKLFDMD